MAWKGGLTGLERGTDVSWKGVELSWKGSLMWPGKGFELSWKGGLIRSGHRNECLHSNPGLDG